MKRLLVLFAGFVALAAVAAACDSSPVNPDAATVNGTHIRRASLVSDANAFASLQGDPFSLVNADNPNTYTAQGMAKLLFTKVTDIIVSDAAKKYGVSVSSSDVDSLHSQDLGAYASLPADKLNEVLRRAALENKVFDYVTTKQWWTDADVAAYYNLVKESKFDQACTKHILVADEATANKLLTQLKGGADFATLAAANSTDTSNKDKGGDLGCNPHGAFVTEFENAVANAKDGDLIGPVKTNFGYHIISVTSGYRVRTLDEAKDQIVTSFKDSQASGWVDYVLRSAKVTVDRRYGSWSSESLSITPPAGASGASSSSSAATTAPK